ncbi:MAG: response regulator [Bacteroidetes bacterium]|jgi:DNA-binding response OmpR family regulator|nr:response regulator [Bacteroidota bacterium]
MKILIVEDEIPMLNGLKDNLEYEGYTVDTATEGITAFEKITGDVYDLILLDVMLPGMSGMDICKKAREQGIKTPIIMLTAKGEEIDKVLGLEFGADDYITKPFGLRELLARIKAILRRTPSYSGNADSSQITLGKLTVNFKDYTAVSSDKECKMTYKEFEILHYLYKNKNKAISRDDLMSEIWGMHYEATTRTVDNFILKLRQKIEEDPNKPKVIHTVHGIGYKLAD